MKNRRPALHILFLFAFVLFATAPVLCACPVDADCGAGCAPTDPHDDEGGCDLCTPSSTCSPPSMSDGRGIRPVLNAPVAPAASRPLGGAAAARKCGLLSGEVDSAWTDAARSEAPLRI